LIIAHPLNAGQRSILLPILTLFGRERKQFVVFAGG